MSVTGSAFAAALNLKSNWFSLGNQPSGGVGGYWLDDAKGGIYSFGSAPFYGSAGNLALNKPIVGMAATPDGAGLLAGGLRRRHLHLRRRRLLRQHGHLVLNKPIVGMAATPDGGGYWLVASDGGIFTFGDARFYGSTGNIMLNKPIVGMVPTARRRGLLAGGVRRRHLQLRRRHLLRLAGRHAARLARGRRRTGGGRRRLLDARGQRHRAGLRRRTRRAAPAAELARRSPRPTSPMTSIVPSADGQGYTLVDSSGRPSASATRPTSATWRPTVPGYSGRVVGIAASPG